MVTDGMISQTMKLRAGARKRSIVEKVRALAGTYLTGIQS